MKRTIATLILLLALGPARAAWATAADEAPECGSSSMNDDPLRLARVVVAPGASAPILYSHDPRTCQATDGMCPLWGDNRVPAGTSVIVRGERFGDWACVTDLTEGGQATAFIRWANLSLQTTPPPRLSDWIGLWEDGPDGDFIDIRPANGGKLEVHGHGFWPGRDEAIRLGGFLEVVAPKGGRLEFIQGGPDEVGYPDDLCAVVLRLIGPHLVGADNHQCGGLNVIFSFVFYKIQDNEKIMKIRSENYE